jgi:hypothetical protein
MTWQFAHAAGSFVRYEYPSRVHERVAIIGFLVDLPR